MMLGRRTWVLLGDAIQIVGGLICATSYSPGQLIAGRAIEVSQSKIMSDSGQILKVLGIWKWLSYLHGSHIHGRNGGKTGASRSWGLHTRCHGRWGIGFGILAVSI